jgi:hypothetical protein
MGVTDSLSKLSPWPSLTDRVSEFSVLKIVEGLLLGKSCDGFRKPR